MTIPQSIIDEVKARVDIVELISSYGVQVRQSGANKKACCPFHHEKTPSFVINEANGYYHCFGCGEAGNVFKFVQKMDGLTFIESVKKLADMVGVEIVEKEDPAAGKRKRLYALMAEVADFYHRCLKSTKEAEIAREYLANRDLDEKTQEDFLIGYAPKGIANMKKWAEKHGYTLTEMEEAGLIIAPKDASDQGYHRFSGRLIFSIKDKQGRVVAFSGRQLVESKHSGKYVNSPETLIFKKSNVLFGFDKAAGNIAKNPHHTAIVCEGQIDTIRLHLSGFNNSLASQGTAFTEEHVRMLKRVADEVILVFDDDSAGHKATVKTAGLCLTEGLPVRVVSLPGGDDPDSFLRSHPASDFQSLLDNAESIMSFQVRSEKKKELNPDSVDAIARVTKAILATISKSSSAVIKEGMLKEASQLLSLPINALREEMGEKGEGQGEGEGLECRSRSTVEETPKKDESTVVDLRTRPRPSDTELEFCEFLMANETDEHVRDMVKEFLPREVFVHDFTAKFVEAWQNGESGFIAFPSTLEGEEKKWFDRIFLAGSRSLASGLSATNLAEAFIRKLWSCRFERRLSDTEADENEKRLTYRINIFKLRSDRWPDIKVLIREAMKGEE